MVGPARTFERVRVALLTRFLEGLRYATQPRNPAVFSLVPLGLGMIPLVTASVPRGGRSRSIL